ncbi:hypothetical protein C8035_v002802 [Colletotrichum spinosum]|uniref:Uncharacterized protein n=1 Tax=Colletotrichum spinosum TaxID=1347390 RepID=A0A4R8Q114_9PEZI|nr:hypothetical protein C8035_v002802 [Colletotrichum spinosum]
MRAGPISNNEDSLPIGDLAPETTVGGARGTPAEYMLAEVTTSAASSVPSSTASSGISDTQTIHFASENLGTWGIPPNRVIQYAARYQIIAWWSSPSQNVTVKSASWIARSENGGISETILSQNVTPPVSQQLEGRASLRSRRHHLSEGFGTISERQAMAPITFPDQSKLQLPVGNFISNETWQRRYAGQDMYVRLYWALHTGESTVEGSTRSGIFTVIDHPPGTEQFKSANDSLSKKIAESPADKNGEDLALGDPGNLPLASATASLFPNGATATGVTPSSSHGLDASTSDPNSRTSGGGGLPPGTIAGIVVGSVAGIALIAFLLWFLFRRRRRSRDSDGVYGSGHGPHEYLADKEPHARVTESPHSPYSDDGQQQPQQQRHLEQHDQQVALPISTSVGTATPAASTASSPTDHPRHFATYEEEEQTPIAARSVDNVNNTHTGPRSSTPNINSNVSHLIEDGMTEDEIRRLEEEERALDAAIEQHGQRRS